MQNTVRCIVEVCVSERGIASEKKIQCRAQVWSIFSIHAIQNMHVKRKSSRHGKYRIEKQNPELLDHAKHTTTARNKNNQHQPKK